MITHKILVLIGLLMMAAPVMAESYNCTLMNDNITTTCNYPFNFSSITNYFNSNITEIVANQTANLTAEVNICNNKLVNITYTLLLCEQRRNELFTQNQNVSETIGNLKTEKASRGSKKGIQAINNTLSNSAKEERAKIPYGLSLAICEAVETGVKKE